MSIWRWVKNYRGIYKISKYGRLKSVARVLVYPYKSGQITQRYPERIMKTRPDKDGYLKTTLCKRSRTKSVYIHRLVAETFIPNPDNLPEVNHKDLDKTNNHWTNLEWCTSKGNKQHSSRNDAVSYGESRPNAKLTNDKARKIFLATGLYRNIAKKFNTHIEKVSSIKTRKTWRRATEGLP